MGLDMLVPLDHAYQSVPWAMGERRESPFATRSGLMRPSSTGPVEENWFSAAVARLRAPPETASRTDPTVTRFLARPR